MEKVQTFVNSQVTDMGREWIELKRKIINPALIAEKSPYLVRFAETPDEIAATQKLRYRVFNLEQGIGLRSAKQDGIDKDEFDKDALHLAVYAGDNGNPVGTYRILPPGDVTEHLYSAREFNIAGMEPILSKTLEVGRSCVAPEYRDGSVVALLWNGIAEVMRRAGMRYLIGCASLEDTRREAAPALYEHLLMQNLVDKDIHAVPRAEFEPEKCARSRINAIREDSMTLRSLMPPLLKGYLRLGARICGPPAFDPDFGTTDFLILLDVARLPERYSRHFRIKLEER